MANRPKGFGLTAELNRKMAAKYEPEKEEEARAWMEAVVGEPICPDVRPDEPLGPDRLHEGLKDGIFLCKLFTTVSGTPIKYNQSKMAFKMMENIGKFLEAAEKYGLNKTDLFQTVDLYEKANMWQVVCTIHAFGRKAQAKGADVPPLGPKEASKNVRSFTEEQKNAGKNVIGLQMGTNQVASQKGMSFGTSRHIADIKCDDVSREGQSVIGLQSGSNQGATASGQSFGKSRGIIDVHK